MSIRDNVRSILEDSTQARDDFSLLTMMYKERHFNGSWRDFALSGIQTSVFGSNREIQKNEVTLRGKQWYERQKSCNKYKSDYRKRQEMPERTATEIVEVDLKANGREESILKRIFSLFS